MNDLSEKKSSTREQILEAALKRFAHYGYAGTGIQEIADAAQVTKAALYYHFRSKAALYKALVDFAHDERYRLMQTAATRSQRLEEQLEEIVTSLFDFLKGHKELTRLTFSTAFASSGEIPPEVQTMEKCQRNFEFIHDLVKAGLARGELNPEFDGTELAMGIYGLVNIHVMAQVIVQGDHSLTRQTARRIVQLFLQGAGAGAFRPDVTGPTPTPPTAVNHEQ